MSSGLFKALSPALSSSSKKTTHHSKRKPKRKPSVRRHPTSTRHGRHS